MPRFFGESGEEREVLGRATLHAVDMELPFDEECSSYPRIDCGDEEDEIEET